MKDEVPDSWRSVLGRFGQYRLRLGQGRIISLALAGKNVLGLLPTGYGKSLCYQAAAELMGGTSVVVSPLLALMREQVAMLQAKGISARRFDSTLTEEERTLLLMELEDERVRLLYVAPESLENPRLEAALQGVKKSLFIIDEAHCISQWGHSFRPDYLRLPTWVKGRGFACVMALTATATQRVRQDLCSALGISPRHVVAVSPYRANIHRSVRVVEDAPAAESALIEYLSDAKHTPCIVYTRTRKGAEMLTGRLGKSGVSAVCYHAGQPLELRDKLQDDFLHDRAKVLVATIAFGMGIDKSNVRSVVHINLPSSPEAYLQESGRAGRDGADAESLVLLHGAERVEARNRIYAAEPDAEGVLRCVRWLMPAAPRVVAPWELETMCDVAEDVPRRALDFLRERGAVRVEHPGYQFYKVRPLFPLSTILDGRTQKEIRRLRWLEEFRSGEVMDAADAWNCSFAEAMEQLRECAASGEWSVSFRRRAHYLVPGKPADARAVAEEISAIYAERREGELQRLEALETMLCSSLCLNSALEAYFTGKPLPGPCGHCSACRKSVPELPPYPPAKEMPPDSALPEFDRPAQRRRFLAGVSSPAILARRLWGHRFYGCGSHTPWEML